VSGSWKCPDCGGWVAYWVAVHHCQPAAAASANAEAGKGEQTGDEQAPPAGQPAGEPQSAPGYSAHMGGMFERVSRSSYELAPKWGFRP
jgi:hypothetical protein